MLGTEEFRHVFLYESFSVSSVQCATCPIHFGCGWGTRVTAARFHPSSSKGPRHRIPESILSGLYSRSASTVTHQLTNMHERLHIVMFFFFFPPSKMPEGPQKLLLCSYKRLSIMSMAIKMLEMPVLFPAMLKGLFSQGVKLNYIILKCVNAWWYLGTPG